MNIGLIILIIVACIIAVNYNQYEPFDATNSVFEPLGQPRYGLRGEKLDTRAINDCYYDHYKCYTNTFMNDPKTARYYGRIYGCDDRKLHFPKRIN